MKHLMSDLHLEFGPLELPGGDTLLLAGDVCVADFLRPERTDKEARKHQDRCKQFFFEECAKYNRVFYVMGNHEHYHGLFDENGNILRDFLAGTNVRLLEDEFVDLDEETRLFGGTFWTNYDNADYFCLHAAKDMMNDHSLIKKMHMGVPRAFLPNDAMDVHYRAVDKLKSGLNEKKTVVMSHHAPHRKSISDRYRNSLLNGAYHSNQEELMLDNPQIVMWVHGHVHESFNYKVGECNVVCNPRGYAGYELNKNFDVTHLLENV